MASQQTIEAESLSSRTWFRVVMVVDLLAQLALLVFVLSQWFGGETGSPTWILAAGASCLLAGAIASLFSIGLLAKALTWRRRTALLAVILVLLRTGPWAQHTIQVSVTLWALLIWLALLIEGKRVARAVAQATGEEVLSLDPLNPDR